MVKSKKKFKRGATVTWTSKSKTKTGKVIGFVAAGDDPTDRLSEKVLNEHKLPTIGLQPTFRGERYLVSVPDEHRKPWLYGPRVVVVDSQAP